MVRERVRAPQQRQHDSRDARSFALKGRHLNSLALQRQVCSLPIPSALKGRNPAVLSVETVAKRHRPLGADIGMRAAYLVLKHQAIQMSPFQGEVRIGSTETNDAREGGESGLPFPWRLKLKRKGRLCRERRPDRRVPGTCTCNRTWWVGSGW